MLQLLYFDGAHWDEEELSQTELTIKKLYDNMHADGQHGERIVG
jgi:hypothetical protein